MIEFRVFVSSPGDVRDERWIAERVLDRLAHKWGRRVRVTPVFWEHEPLAADATYQAQITPPEECDAVVVILWSRLGTLLPADITRPDGSRYDSGTEYELERSLAAHEEHGRPEVLVYHKTKQASARLTSREEVEERLRQSQMLEETIERLFRNPDGSAARAMLSFEEPERFGELLHKHLEALIVRRIEEEEAREGGEGEGAVASARTSLWQGSPFRGLSVFQPEDAAIFCGRSVRVRQILDALRAQELSGRPFVVVVGASGSGKSSLVRAGVLPRLMVPGSVGEVAFWRRAMWIPGTSADPFEGLARALLAEGALPELAASGTVAADLAADLRERPGAAVSRLRMGLENAAGAERRRAGMDDGTVSASEIGLVLLVDQAEELFSAPTIGPDDVKRLDAALATLAGSGLVRILATLRSDFYDRFAALPELMRLKEGAGQYDLPAPDPEEIARMIRGPAEIAGLRWEREPESGRRLDDVVRDDAVADPGALPLLEFTLDELYRRSEDGRLTFAAYRALGGIEGALAHRADQVFAGLSTQARSALDPVLLALVRPSPDPDAPPSRRRAPRTDFDAVPGGGELVDTFVRERLLTVDRGEDGGARVSVAHEALLRAWPRAVDWRERHAGQLATRARVESQAATWTAEGEDAGFLLPAGSLLDEARALLGTPGAPLGPAEERLVRASAEAADERRRKGALLKRLVAAAIVVVALGSLLVWDLYVREHVGHYGALRLRHGAPEGVGRVSDDQLDGRWWSYEVTQRGRIGSVVRVAAVDGAGRPSYFHDFEGFLSRYAAGADFDFLDPRQTIGRETVWEVRYDRGEVSHMTALDRTGRTVYELQYKERAGKRGEDLELTAEYSLEGLAIPQAESGAALVKTRWNPEGLLEEVVYLDANGDRRPDRNLSWGLRVEEFDAAGMPARAVNLGPDDEPASNREGWARADFRWRNGLRKRVDLYDAEDRPVLARSGFSRIELEHDRYGNVSEERYRNEQGRPMPGVSIVRYSHSGEGRLERTVFLDADEEPVAAPNGAYGTAFEFDDEGLMRRIVFLGPDGEALDLPDIVYSAMSLEWGEAREGVPGRRSLAQIDYLDADGEPAHLFHLEGVFPGYASEAYKYNRRGDLVEIRYLDEEGRTLAPFGGYAKILKRYDERGRMIGQRYEDAAGRPAVDLAGCAAWRQSFDAHSKPEERECHDSEGNPRIGGLGAFWRIDYDESGLPSEDRFLDERGRPMQSVLGCWVADLRDLPPGKDDLDRLPDMIFQRFFELAAGNPVPMGDGCSRLATRYDARGDVRRIDYYTAPDQPHPFDNGCSRVRVRHDFRGREIERVCLDEDGRPTTAEAGWERVTVDYEGGGPRESYWNAAAQPVSVQPDTLDGLVALWSADGGSGDGASSWDRGGDRQVRRASDPPRLPAPAPEPARPQPQPQPQPRTEPALRPPPAGQEEAALEVRRLADRLRGEYDDHLDALLDASDRDRAEGEKRIEELLEELEEAASHLHDAAEEWAEDWEKPNQVTRIRREYAAGKADVGRLAGEVAALAGSHPLGGTASATLAEIRRRASALP